MPIAYLTRKETISCSHRLHNEHLSEQDNKLIYGKCNNFWGHGHNYTVEITIRGPVDSTTGMVMNLSDLKVYVQKVLGQMDHKNLDKDVDYFKSVVSTTENVAIYIFTEMKKLMPKPELLYEIKVCETDKNIVSYRGE
ncbi:6-pyruvoyl tetrahydrobiopterin synthase isoform X2 [Harpegnathos saltator]|uniref:6-pyruvoyl tetrahydrobiopterin synthase n=2 Tax=Harpegnathos saltator TaxID=610380 RepID=E2BKT5_HARSA|nr:6-pyruvoyl tetrahydrobiopterin synthase isoform X2 [Harpegnathos saltator]EFN83684.1 6-pyruvoyl tetrahydrobiopterin synthase [Harpegnathos saltator]